MPEYVVGIFVQVVYQLVLKEARQKPGFGHSVEKNNQFVNRMVAQASAVTVTVPLHDLLLHLAVNAYVPGASEKLAAEEAPQEGVPLE